MEERIAKIEAILESIDNLLLGLTIASDEQQREIDALDRELAEIKEQLHSLDSCK